MDETIKEIIEERKQLKDNVHRKRQKRNDFIEKHLSEIEKLMPSVFYGKSRFRDWLIKKNKDFFYTTIKKKKKTKLIPNMRHKIYKQFFSVFIASEECKRDNRDNYRYSHITLTRHYEDPYMINTTNCDSEIWNIIKEILPVIEKGFLSYYIIKEKNRNSKIKSKLKKFVNDNLICFYCNAENLHNALYCNYCGSKIKTKNRELLNKHEI